jgi:hypothetical protein
MLEQPDSVSDIIYDALPTISDFHRCDDFVRGIRGPYGSGKSTGCCWEIMRRAAAQEADKRGRRRTRFLVVRNTYRELHDTTLKTWLDWFPEDAVGQFYRGDMAHKIEYALPDGTSVETEVLFRALDKPADVKKVLSLEITGAWINEARELPKGVIDALADRTGRYPAVRDGGCTWRGIFMDTNPPDDDHWWYRLSEDERPSGWRFFNQPPGIFEVGHNSYRTNPKGENLANLEPGYYETRCAGKKRDYILVHYGNQYGFVQEGKPVYPEYVDTSHCSDEDLEPIRGQTIYVGIDFGLTPAATFAQRDVMGRWRVIDELVTEDMGAMRFSELLGPKMRGEYADFEFEVYGDPAGDDRAQTDETTPIVILQSRGIPAMPAPSNDPVMRHSALEGPLNRFVDGKPGFVISPRCKITRKGLAGGYHYKRVQVAGEERFQDKPLKNKFSHPVESLEYLLLGAGEGDNIIPSGSSWGEVIESPNVPIF